MQATSFSARIFFGIVSIVPLWATLSWGVDVGAPHSYNMRPLVVTTKNKNTLGASLLGHPIPTIAVPFSWVARYPHVPSMPGWTLRSSATGQCNWA